jgi:SAM-dependent methyltransferase
MTIDVEKIYDSIANDYENDYADERVGKQVEAENAFIKEMMPYQGLGSLIDCGCGTGLLLDLINIDVENYVGVDISKGMMKIAKNKNNKYTFIHGDIFNHKAKYDFCVALFAVTDVFGTSMIKKSVDLLNDKGMFVSTFINSDGPYKKLHCFEKNGIDFEPMTYKYSEICNELEKNGFDWYYILGIANIEDSADVQTMTKELLNKRHLLADAKYYFVMAQK